MKYFRVDAATGNIQGATDKTGEALEQSLRPGQVAVPWAPDVRPYAHRWDFDAQCWVDRPEEPRDLNWEQARVVAYPQIPDQVGALMKAVLEVLAIPDVAAAVSPARLAEITALGDQIAAVKEENPKPST